MSCEVTTAVSKHTHAHHALFAEHDALHPSSTRRRRRRSWKTIPSTIRAIQDWGVCTTRRGRAQRGCSPTRHSHNHMHWCAAGTGVHIGERAYLSKNGHSLCDGCVRWDHDNVPRRWKLKQGQREPLEQFVARAFRARLAFVRHGVLVCSSVLPAGAGAGSATWQSW